MKQFIKFLSISTFTSFISLNAFSAPLTLDEFCFGDQIFCIDYPKTFNEANCKSKNIDIPFGLNIKEENLFSNLKGYCSSNDSAKLSYGYSEQSININSQFQQAITKTPLKNVTYKKIAKKYFIVSGFIADKIFYQINKEIDKNQYVGFIFHYDKKDKKKYDQYLNKTVDNFLSGYR